MFSLIFKLEFFYLLISAARYVSGKHPAPLKAQLERTAILGVGVYVCKYVYVGVCVTVCPTFSSLPKFCLQGRWRDYLIVFLSLISVPSYSWTVLELCMSCTVVVNMALLLYVCVCALVFESSTVCLPGSINQFLHTFYLNNLYGFKGYVRAYGSKAIKKCAKLTIKR